jgi:hypothetical protein
MWVYDDRMMRGAAEARGKAARGDLDLVECSDGIFRSPAEKSAFDAQRYLDGPDARQS